MRQLNFDDILRAQEWDLDASFIESKLDSSVLVCLCQAVIERKNLSHELRDCFVWALDTGAQLKMLEVNSAPFFQLTTYNGAYLIWEKLFSHGYTLGKVMAKVGISNGIRAGRLTTKLGLLCSSPYCLSPELPNLVSLLIHRGIDPNERDSDGYTPLGRLNDQLKQHDVNQVAIDMYLGTLQKAVEVMLDLGAEVDGILPTAEMFAAKSIQDLLRAKREKFELHQHILPLDDMTISHPVKTL